MELDANVGFVCEASIAKYIYIYILFTFNCAIFGYWLRLARDLYVCERFSAHIIVTLSIVVCARTCTQSNAMVSNIYHSVNDSKRTKPQTEV